MDVSESPGAAGIEAESNGATRRLARFLAGLGFAALPAETVAASKIFVLDLIGTMLGALHAEETRMAVEVVRELGGTEECSVLGQLFRTSCQQAAFLNGLSAHVLELDDTHRDSITHVGAPVIPAALAMAEREGASGADFLAAVAVGYEATLRIARAVQPSHWRRGFLSMGTCGTFGAAAAAGHVLGLDAEALANGFGLAGIQAAGLNSSIYGEGDMGKRLCPSHAAAQGVFSALLAAKGFTGSTAILEQRKGFCQSFADEYDLAPITEGLGTSFEIMRTGLKPYACCRYNHAAIDGLLSLMGEHGIAADAIGAIRVRTYDVAVTNRPHRTRPLSLFDAKMSIPFCLAVAALRGTVNEGDFTAELLADAALSRFAERVRVESDAAMSAEFPREWPAEVEILLADGRLVERRIAYPKGEPEAPMSDREVEEKFMDLASAALSPEAARAVIGEVQRLERSEGVEGLLRTIREGLKG
jgi:2-methylcitrate dehydratase PrpD